ALDFTSKPSPALSKVTVAETSRRCGGVPAFASPAESAIEKQLACAAASSSSGLVLPLGSSLREAQVTGWSLNIPLLLAVTLPAPLARSPSHTTSARRIAAIVASWRVRRLTYLEPGPASEFWVEFVFIAAPPLDGTSPVV